jgi:ubiquitin C-terminal hydrolase
VCFTNRKPAEQAFAGEFRALMNKLESAQPGQAVAPMNTLKFLMLLNPVFGYRQQADAQECINTILQVLHTALSVNVKINNMPGVGQSESFELQRLGNDRYAGHVEANGYSVIEELFGSQFLSKLVYDGCGHVSYSHDPYTIVPVPIPQQALTLYDCFDAFIESEQVQNVTCDKCKEQKSAVKELSFWTLPQVLVIQLKRFNHALKKVEKFIEAPMTLNMSKYVTHPRVSEVIKTTPKALQLYDLKGIICHVGGLNGGHYYARCWRPEDSTNKGNWINFDDASVSPIPEDQLQSPSNYCFFYEMKNSSKEVWTH